MGMRGNMMSGGGVMRGNLPTMMGMPAMPAMGMGMNMGMGMGMNSGFMPGNAVGGNFGGRGGGMMGRGGMGGQFGGRGMMGNMGTCRIHDTNTFSSLTVL